MIKSLRFAPLALTSVFIISCSSEKEESDLSGCPDAVIGNGTMSCGGQTYKIVQIGDQVWMAENLNYNVSGSKCYDNQESNCDIYGRLYNWTAAMVLPYNCNGKVCASQTSVKYRGICPFGWHIPSNAEWDTLTQYVNSNCSIMDNCKYVGKELKNTSGWSGGGNGTDTYEFAALPGGSGNSDEFFEIGHEGYWWSSTENLTFNALYRNMSYSDWGVYLGSGGKGFFISVRCVKD